MCERECVIKQGDKLSLRQKYHQTVFSAISRQTDLKFEMTVEFSNFKLTVIFRITNRRPLSERKGSLSQLYMFAGRAPETT
jgi:hypothetical protein